jgi:hypothetical protein
MAPWLVLGTLAFFVVGGVGFLPGTGGKIKGLTAPADADATHHPDAPERQRRSLILRASFAVLWPVLFFVASAITMSALAGAFSAETGALQQQLHQQSAQKHTGWIFVVSFVLFVLGCCGVLPFTAATKKVETTRPVVSAH